MSDPNPYYGPQQPPYGSPPGGVPPYGPQPPHGGAYYPGHGPPPTPYPYPYTYIPTEHRPPAGSTLTALVISVLLVPMCVGNITPLIGTVMAGIALSERSRAPERHDKFRRYAWISNGIHLGVFAVLAGLFAVLIIVDA